MIIPQTYPMLGQAPATNPFVQYVCNSPDDPERDYCQVIAEGGVDPFRQLQAEINRFALLGMFDPLMVNGAIDADTLDALALIAAQIGQPIPASLDDIAKNVYEWIATLRATPAPDVSDEVSLPPDTSSAIDVALRACQRDINDTRCQQAREACALAKGTTAYNTPEFAALCQTASGRSRYWLVGGLTLAAALGTGYLILRNRRRRQVQTVRTR